MLLESRSKFDLKSPNKNQTLSPDGFFSWSNNHMYRTQYNDMSIKVSILSFAWTFYLEPC